MKNSFSNAMETRSDEELIEILTKLRSEYQPEAIVAAETEFKKRNLTFDNIDTSVGSTQGKLAKTGYKCRIGLHNWKGSECASCGKMRHEVKSTED